MGSFLEILKENRQTIFEVIFVFFACLGSMIFLFTL